MIDNASSRLDRPRRNCREMRKAKNGRPDPEGERHRRHPCNAPRSRNGAAQTMRRHRTDHSARSIAARLPGKRLLDDLSSSHALIHPHGTSAWKIKIISALSLSSFRHTRLYKLTSRKFLKSNCESKRVVCSKRFRLR